MKRIFVFVCLLIAFYLGMVQEGVRSQAIPRMWAETLLEVSTHEIPKPTRVQVKLDRWEPGTETGRHSHPGPAVFIMIEGELEEIRQGGGTRTLGPGQVFWNPGRTEHNVRNLSGRTARAVVVHLDPAPSGRAEGHLEVAPKKRTPG
jgi:quercetin dioxygenase-like cupin family protein